MYAAQSRTARKPVRTPAFEGLICVPSEDPEGDLRANVVSLLKGKLGVDRAQGVAHAALRMLSPALGGHVSDAPMALSGITGNDKLSLKIWLLEFAELQAKTLSDAGARLAYEEAARANISARLGR